MAEISFAMTIHSLIDYQNDKVFVEALDTKELINKYIDYFYKTYNRRELNEKTLINWLGLLGLISLLSYIAAVIFSPLAYPDYNWMAQAVSDLSAANAPSKMLWNQLSSLYGICQMVSIMMVCVFVQNKLTKTLRIGIYLFAVMNWITNIGFSMFPLSNSGYAGNFQDMMHGFVVTPLVILFSIVSLIVIIIGSYQYKQYKTLAKWAAATLF